MSKLKNKDIAIALNISTAAVSMALNNKPGVSEETRRRVLTYYQKHADLDESPFIIPTQKSLILVVHRQSGKIVIDKPFFTEMISSIETEARKKGYLLTISHYNPSMNPAEYIDSLNEQNASGVLLLATELTEEFYSRYYSKLTIPCVLLDGYLDLIPCDSVTLDNSNAIVRAYKYAYDLGHRNIGYLKCSTTIPNFVHRFDGFCKARRTFEPDLTDAPVVFSLPGNLEESNLEMKKALGCLPDTFTLPTCFIADLDFIAIGAMIALKEKGYTIPDDISLIGFDDIEFSTISSPSLTTLHLHQQTLGRLAVNLLVDRLHEPESCIKNIRLSSELIIRNSVKKL